MLSSIRAAYINAHCPSPAGFSRGRKVSKGSSGRHRQMRKKFESEELVTLLTENLQNLYEPLDSSIIEAIKDEDTARLIAWQCLNAA